ARTSRPFPPGRHQRPAGDLLRGRGDPRESLSAHPRGGALRRRGPRRRNDRAARSTLPLHLCAPLRRAGLPARHPGGTRRTHAEGDRDGGSPGVGAVLGYQGLPWSHRPGAPQLAKGRARPARVRVSPHLIASYTMPLARSAAVVIGSFPLGESDLLVTFFTRQHGKMRGVARHARRLRSRFGGALEPFTLGEMIAFEGRESDLVQI